MQILEGQPIDMIQLWSTTIIYVRKIGVWIVSISYLNANACQFHLNNRKQ